MSARWRRSNWIWNAPDGQTLAEIRRKLREIAATRMTTRTVHDPFTGKDVQVSDDLKDRLRGKYAVGPVTENGEPEFGWRQHEVPPIQIEAAAHIEALEAALRASRIVLIERGLDPKSRIVGVIDTALAPEQDKCVYPA